MSSENDPELSKKAMMDKRAKIKSLKDKMRANKNPTKEIEKIEDIEEKENKEEKIEKENNENNSKNILDELIKFDEENNKDEILNDKMENRSNESSNDDNNKDENNIININEKNEEINIEIKNNNITENINDNITNTNIDDSNKNINIIEGNKLEFSSRSHSGSKISNKKEEKDDEIYSEKQEKEEKEENEEKEEINIISSDKKEKEEINIISSDKKEEKKNNIKKEIKDINEKKTKSKILIRKVKPSNNNTENNPKENIISITEPTSNNNKINKKKEINSNFLHKNTTIVTKIQRNPNKILKKSLTTYTNKLTKKKFDPVKFNEYLKGINEYENRKKEKIEHMKKQEEEKELKKITYHPKINKESNLKFKVNPKNYSTVERLYTQDLMKRKEKKQILSKIYAPTFKPKLYTNKHVINKTNQRNQNIKTEIYESENNLIFEDNEDYEEKNNFEEEKERRNNSVKKRTKEKKIEDEGEMVPDDSKIENKLRSLLFKNKKGTGKRNKSVEKRKKTNFNLD